MAFSFKRLSETNNRAKYSVHGWIREAEKELKLEHIPEMLKSVCIIFFDNTDTFSIVDDHIQLSNNNKMIKHMGFQYHESGYRSGYGSFEIESMSDNDITWDWDLKIINECHCIKIGISSMNKDEYQYYYTTAGIIFCEGKGCKRVRKANKNDIISVRLNMKQGIVRFYVNGEKQANWCDNVRKHESIKYRLRVVVFLNECVEITNFPKRQ